LIYVDDESSEVGSRHFQKLLATNSTELLLKPDITHFTNDQVIQKLMEDSAEEGPYIDVSHQRHMT
jgi:hypothetical protein